MTQVRDEQTYNGNQQQQHMKQQHKYHQHQTHNQTPSISLPFAGLRALGLAVEKNQGLRVLGLR
jgi:hypothetical protein